MALALLSLIIFTSMTLACLSAPGYPTNSENAPDRASQNEMRVEVFLKLSDSCSLLDPEVENPFFCRISATLAEPLENGSQLSLYLPTSSATFIATATYGYEIRRIEPTLIPMGYGTGMVPLFYFDEGLSGFDITILGNIEGLSLLWRNVVDLHLIAPTFSRAIPTSYRIQIEVPNTLEVTSIKSPVIQTLNPEESPGENSKLYTLLMPVSLNVYYRPANWLPLSIAAFLVIVCVVMFMPYLLTKINLGSVHLITKIVRDTSLIAYRKLKAERLFTLYILCSLLMVSLSLVAGPDPRIKVYAVAPPYLASALEEELAKSVGPVQIIGPHDTVSEFETMANLGVIKAVVISYYPEIALDRVIKYTLEAMSQVPLIVVDESMADPDLAQEIKLRFGEKVIAVQGLHGESITNFERELKNLRVYNPLGLEPGIGAFKAMTTVIAVLSFLVVFLGLAFLSSRLIEAGRSKGLGSMPEAIMLSAFVFYFTQAIYMTSSVLLAMPVGLHAVTSGSKELTVVGLLGFGGGSRPRAISGILGFFLGAFIAIRGKSDIDRWGIVAFLFLMALLVIDPFTGGELFYDALLFFLSGPRTEIIRTSIFYTKDILSSMGRLFGGWVTGIYGLSTGEILFYAGALPIFLFPMLKRSTATVLLLISGIAAGSGFIRTAEMTPYKTVASLIPGLTVGLVVVAVFVFLSFIEDQIRARL